MKWLGGIVASVLLLTGCLKMLPIFYPDNDFNRDVYEAALITQGDWRLLGPPLNFGPAYTGPYFYYWLALPLMLLGLEPVHTVWWQVGWWVGFVMLGAWLVHKRWGGAAGAVYYILLGWAPAALSSSVHPGNAYSYWPILGLWLVLAFGWKPEKWWQVVGWGAFSAFLLHFHWLNILVVGPSLLWQASQHGKLSSASWRWWGWLLVGSGATFLPIALYELKSGFFLTKETLQWLKSGIVPRCEPRLDQLGCEASWSQRVIGMSQLYFAELRGAVLVALAAIAASATRRHQRKSWPAFGWCLAFCLILLSFGLFRQRFLPYYIFPIVILGLVTASLSVSFLPKLWRILTAVGLALFLIPGHLLKPTQPWQDPFLMPRQTVAQLIAHKVVQPGDQVNVLAVDEPTHSVPYGFLYRFYLLKAGITPLTQYQYAESQVLIIPVKVKNFELTELSTWETQQFGQAYLGQAQKYEWFGQDLYILRKAPLELPPPK